MKKLGTFAALILSGCGSNSQMTDNTTVVVTPVTKRYTYVKDALPIFQTVCSSCHNGSSGLPNWLDYSTAFAKRELIYQKVVIDRTMPMGKSMFDSDRNILAEWIKDGALYGDSPMPSNSPSVAPSASPSASPSVSPSVTPTPSVEPSSMPTASPYPVPTVLTYINFFLPLVQDKCIMCHGPGSSLPNWTNYDTAYAYRASIRNHVFMIKDMPKVGTLTAQQRQDVANWVDDGAPYDVSSPTPSSTPTPTPTVTTSPSPSPIPTSSPTPTASPSPSPTASPSPSATPSDVVSIDRAEWKIDGGELRVEGNVSDSATLTLYYNSSTRVITANGSYEFRFTGVYPKPSTVTVMSSKGGVATKTVSNN